MTATSTRWRARSAARACREIDEFFGGSFSAVARACDCLLPLSLASAGAQGPDATLAAPIKFCVSRRFGSAFCATFSFLRESLGRRASPLAAAAAALKWCRAGSATGHLFSLAASFAKKVSLVGSESREERRRALCFLVVSARCSPRLTARVRTARLTPEPGNSDALLASIAIRPLGGARSGARQRAHSRLNCNSAHPPLFFFSLSLYARYTT